MRVLHIDSGKLQEHIKRQISLYVFASCILALSILFLEEKLSQFFGSGTHGTDDSSLSFSLLALLIK